MLPTNTIIPAESSLLRIIEGSIDPGPPRQRRWFTARFIASGMVWKKQSLLKAMI